MKAFELVGRDLDIYAPVLGLAGDLLEGIGKDRGQALNPRLGELLVAVGAAGGWGGCRVHTGMACGRARTPENNPDFWCRCCGSERSHPSSAKRPPNSEAGGATSLGVGRGNGAGVPTAWSDG